MANYLSAAILLLFLWLFTPGCHSPTVLDPAKQQVTVNGITVEQLTSQNPQGATIRVEEEYKEGTLTRRKVSSDTKGSQWFSVPDFTGENWTMYAGIALAIGGGVMFFFPLTSPLAGWFVAGGVGLVTLGSWLKSDMAPWVTGGLIVTGLGYAFYRNRKALRNAVQGIEKGGGSLAKQAVYENTDHADDKVIDKLKR